MLVHDTRRTRPSFWREKGTAIPGRQWGRDASLYIQQAVELVLKQYTHLQSNLKVELLRVMCSVNFKHPASLVY
jgi:hypothetical protein